MKRFLHIFFGIVLTASAVMPLVAQESAKPTAGGAPSSGFRAEFLTQWNDFSKKTVDLAEAMPVEKYSWRPGPGVRSVGEVYAHIAGGNFWFLNMVGVQPPADVDVKKIDSLKEKADIVAVLKKSCEQVKQAILKTSDAELDKPAKIMGRPGTVREVFFMLATHQPEHLGQSIAYARMNNVIPPWTAERQTKQQPAPMN